MTPESKFEDLINNNKDVASEIYSLLPTKDFFSLAQASKRTNNSISYSYRYWRNRIKEETGVNPVLLENFITICHKNNININYKNLFHNLYTHRKYLSRKPLAHTFHFFAFISSDIMEQKKLSQVLSIIEKEKIQQLNLINYSYLVGNKEFITALAIELNFSAKNDLTLSKQCALFALLGGHIKLAKKINTKINAEDIYFAAIESGSVVVFKRAENFIGYSFSIKAKDLLKKIVQYNSINILHYLLKNNPSLSSELTGTHVVSAVEYNSIDIIQYFLETNPSIANQINDENRLLFCAFEHCSLETIKLIIKNMSEDEFLKNIYVKNKDGLTLLHAALKNTLFRKSVVHYLLNDCTFNRKIINQFNLIRYAAEISVDALKSLEGFIAKDTLKRLVSSPINYTSLKKIHFIEYLARASTLEFKKLKPIIEYLAELSETDLIKHNFTESLLIIFAKKPDVEGVKYCLFYLNQDPSEQLLHMIKIATTKKTFDTRKDKYISVDEKEEFKEIKKYLKLKLENNKKDSLNPTMKNKVLQLGNHYHASKLEKMISVLQEYRSNTWHLSRDKGLSSLLKNLKTLTNQNDVNQETLEKLLAIANQKTQSINLKVKAVLEQLSGIIFDTSLSNNNNNNNENENDKPFEI